VESRKFNIETRRKLAAINAEIAFHTGKNLATIVAESATEAGIEQMLQEINNERINLVLLQSKRDPGLLPWHSQQLPNKTFLEDQTSNIRRLDLVKEQLLAKHIIFAQHAQVDAAREETIAADQELRKQVAKEWNDLERLVKDYLQNLRKDTVKFLQSLPKDKLTSLSRNSSQDDHTIEDWEEFKKEESEYNINLGILRDQDLGEQVLINKFDRMLKIAYHLKNQQSNTTEETLTAIKEELRQAMEISEYRSEDESRAPDPASMATQEKSRASNSDSKFLEKLDAMLQNLMDKIDYLWVAHNQEELDSRVRGKFLAACHEFYMHLRQKVSTVFESLKEAELKEFQANMASAKDSSASSQAVNLSAIDKNTVPEKYHYLWDMIRDSSNSVVAKNNIPKKYHYLWDKVDALSNFQSQDLHTMMKAIKSKEFKAAINGHSNSLSLTTIFSKTESARFFEKLRKISAYYETKSKELQAGLSQVAGVVGPAAAAGSATFPRQKK
jgi:hypothetical protein